MRRDPSLCSGQCVALDCHGALRLAMTDWDFLRSRQVSVKKLQCPPGKAGPTLREGIKGLIIVGAEKKVLWNKLIKM
jgi:hypothetical protein